MEHNTCVINITFSEERADTPLAVITASWIFYKGYFSNQLFSCTRCTFTALHLTPCSYKPVQFVSSLPKSSIQACINRNKSCCRRPLSYALSPLTVFPPQGSHIALILNCSISLSTVCLLVLIIAFHYKDIRVSLPFPPLCPAVFPFVVPDCDVPSERACVCAHMGAMLFHRARLALFCVPPLFQLQHVWFKWAGSGDTWGQSFWKGPLIVASALISCIAVCVKKQQQQKKTTLNEKPQPTQACSCGIFPAHMRMNLIYVKCFGWN